MMDLPIRLVFDPEAAALKHDAESTSVHAGYFVESTDVRLWIDIALQCVGDAAQCDFFAVYLDEKRRGVFVRTKVDERSLVDDGKIGNSTVLRMQSVELPVSMTGSQFWIPKAAHLNPKPMQNEWSNAINGTSRLLVWHPVWGLLGLEESHRLGIESLIRGPEMPSGRWNDAVPGSALPERLLRVDSPPPPTLQQWLENTSKSIGKSPKPLMDLPPSRAERRSDPVGNFMLRTRGTVGRAVGQIADWMERSLKRMVKPKSSPSEKAARSTAATAPGKKSAMETSQWVQAIRNWAKHHVQQWNEAIEARRNAAVHRLMEMLDKDPEQGLLYAIPMSEVDIGRGMCAPGSELVAHDWRIGGFSKGADFWSLGSDTRAKLRSKYILLALRELKSGRYERAAFVYAQLLGDFSSAASALEQGKLYRQAAVIYRDRLGHKKKAAELFRRVGDFNETLVLYIAMGMNLEAGDLYTELGQSEQATKSFEAHLGDCYREMRWCDAADVLCAKLNEFDSAIAMLQSHWPNGQQGRTCLQKTLSLLQNAGRHDASGKQVERLLKSPSLLNCGSWPSEFLSDLVRSYPDISVREQAKQGLFEHASQILGSPSHTIYAAAVTAAIRKAIPEDRLLHRDTVRFVERTKQQIKPIHVIRPNAKSSRSLEPLESIELSRETNWFGLVPTSRGPMCFGDRDGTLFVQPAWHEENYSRGKPHERTKGGAFEIRSFFANSGGRRWIRHSGRVKNEVESFIGMLGGSNGKNAFQEGSSFWYDSALCFRMIPANTEVFDYFFPHEFGISEDNESIVQGVFLHKCEGQVRLGTYDICSKIYYPIQTVFEDFQNGMERDVKKLLAESNLDSDSMREVGMQYVLEMPWRISKHKTQTLISCGTQLHIYESVKRIHSDDFSHAIESIQISNRYARPRAIIGMSEGVVLQWLKHDNFQSLKIDDSARNSHSCFLRSGHIAIAHDAGVDVYSNQGYQVKLESAKQCNQNFSSIAADEEVFWTITNDGLVQKWRPL